MMYNTLSKYSQVPFYGRACGTSTAKAPHRHLRHLIIISASERGGQLIRTKQSTDDFFGKRNGVLTALQLFLHDTCRSAWR